MKKFKIIPTSSTQNTNGETTSVTFSVLANINENLSPPNGVSISTTAKSKTARSTIPVIKNLKFGEGVISEFGETRKLEVFGDIGATFDLDVKDSSGTSILDVDNATIVRTGDLGVGESVYEKDVVIPAGTADKTYSVTITEKGSTVRGAGLGNFHDGFTTFSKKQANRPVFTLTFTQDTGYTTLSDSTLNATFDAPGAPIRDLRALSLQSSDVLSENIVTVTRVITKSSGGFSSYVSGNLTTTNASFFITTGNNNNYDSSKVSIVNLNGALTDSGDGDTNDTFTLTFTLLFKSLGDSDLTYNINIPNFLQK